MEKVEAYVAVEITSGPHLVEESVKDGSYGFRNIVCWLNRQLPLSNDPFVKGYRFGFLGVKKVSEVEAQMEPGWGRRFSEPSNPHWPCLAPQNCSWPGCKEIQPKESAKESSSLGKPDNEIGRPGTLKRPLETAVPTSQQGTVQAGSGETVKAHNGFYLSRWSNQEIFDTHLTEGQKANLEKIASSLLRKAVEVKFRESNLRTFRKMEIKDSIPKRFYLKTKGGSKKIRLDNTTTFGAGLPTREKAIYQVDCRIPKVRPLKHILAALEKKQVITGTMVGSDVEANVYEGESEVSTCDCIAAVRPAQVIQHLLGAFSYNKYYDFSR